MKLTLILAIISTCAGCLNFNQNGTTHHVIIGFGIISVNNTNKTVATVTKTQAIGLDISSGARLGISSTTVVTIKTNENLLIEVSNLPGKPLTVTIPK